VRRNPQEKYFDGSHMRYFDYVERRQGPDGKEAFLLPDGTWLSGKRPPTPLDTPTQKYGNLLSRKVTKKPPRWTSANPPHNHLEPLSRKSYPSIFGDTDEDLIPDVDDPRPFKKGDVKSIEEVRLSDEVGHLLADRQAFVPAMEDTMARLRQIGVSGAKVEGRVKTPFSLVNKLRRKYMSALTDIAGTRIVVPDQPSLEIATSAIENEFEILEKEDFYEKPLSGYRAIHYIVRVRGVPVELQLKTRRMAQIADASHTPYKQGRLDAMAMDRLTTLAARADAGDEEVARTIDAILRDKSKIKRELTRKQNPGEARESRIARRLANGGF
jgi:ppGpp synthetase/RelA/SpoT-type nucleotidyltranferase